MASGDQQAPSPLSAQQWLASETRPFDPSSPVPDLTWFKGPLDVKHKLDRQPDLPITAPGGAPTTKIDVDPGVTYQTILGTGISMEEASVSNILKLSPAKRTEVLRKMVDPVSGVGMNLFRVTMGTSDFTGRPWYTYDDLPAGQEDPNMDHFSIQKDIDYGIIGVLEEMLAMNPALTFFASPWSPPAWMKSPGTISGGGLVSSHIPALAKYFRKFVEAYRAQGIPISAVTLQNEPEFPDSRYPTCAVGPDQEAQLVRAIKQEFVAGGIDTKTWIFDHNFVDGVAYAQKVFADPAALQGADGIAFHDYAGEPTEMTKLHELYPSKDVFFTERTLWGVAGVDRVAQYFRNWSRSYVAWVTMLDQNGSPSSPAATQKPRRFIRSTTYMGGEYYPTPEFYLFGLYSKFVRAGAKRISSVYGSAATVTNVAFLNPEGTVVAVVVNQTAARQEFALLSEGNQIWAALEAKTAGSYVWRVGLGKSVRPPAPP